MSDFYSDLVPITDFAAVAEPGHYAPVSEDWWVVLADVEGSTEAIEAGQYRAVNFVGAITIAAVLNAADPVELPFVFGGDGATLLAPPAVRGDVEAALLGVREAARERFGLRLRVGLVPVRDVYAAGHRLLVGRYAASPNYTQAVFLGGGLAHAERLLKDPERGAAYRVTGPATVEPDFTGVECRWKNIRSAGGETVALLVSVPGDDLDAAQGVYHDVLAAVEEIYGPDEARHPARALDLMPSFRPDRLARYEPRVRARGWRRWRYTARIWAQQVLLKLFVAFDVTTDATVWRDYLSMVEETTDVKKFDEMLRMVLAGTPAQRARLEAFLEEAHRAGRIVYGVHVSESAVMTCLVYERMGRQVHFVDGADGGYAMAARGLKRQLGALG